MEGYVNSPSFTWAYGGIHGRRAGLRDRWGESSVRVRVPLRPGARCLVPPRGVHWTCLIQDENQICGCGEIGKHSRFKLCRISVLAGSTPAIRTNSLGDGTGRHAAFRRPCPNGRAGSTPARATKCSSTRMAYGAGLEPVVSRFESGEEQACDVRLPSRGAC